MAIEFPIIAKLAAPQQTERTNESDRRPRSPAKKTHSAVIVSLNSQTEPTGDYSDRVRGASAQRREGDGGSLDPQRRKDVDGVAHSIKKTALPEEEKGRLNMLLKASHMITDEDWPEFISRVDHLVTLREALYRATQALDGKPIRPEQIIRFSPYGEGG